MQNTWRPAAPVLAETGYSGSIGAPWEEFSSFFWSVLSGHLTLRVDLTRHPGSSDNLRWFIKPVRPTRELYGVISACMLTRSSCGDR